MADSKPVFDVLSPIKYHRLAHRKNSLATSFNLKSLMLHLMNRLPYLFRLLEKYWDSFRVHLIFHLCRSIDHYYCTFQDTFLCNQQNSQHLVLHLGLLFPLDTPCYEITVFINNNNSGYNSVHENCMI